MREVGPPPLANAVPASVDVDADADVDEAAPLLVVNDGCLEAAALMLRVLSRRLPT